jgi:hypothetical protein
MLSHSILQIFTYKNSHTPSVASVALPKWQWSYPKSKETDCSTLDVKNASSHSSVLVVVRTDSPNGYRE